MMMKTPRTPRTPTGKSAAAPRQVQASTRGLSTLDLLPPSLLQTLKERAVPRKAQPSSANGPLPFAFSQWLYGRGPSTLKPSLVKLFVILMANVVLLYALVSLSVLCWYKSLCFASEYSGAPTGGSRLVYSTALSQGIVPAALVLILVIFPGAILSVRLQLPWMLGTSWVLTSLSAAGLAIVSASTFALLGGSGITTASNTAWAALPYSTQTLSYSTNGKPNQDKLTEEMKSDAATVAVIALAGAVATGLCAVALAPFGRAVFTALHHAL